MAADRPLAERGIVEIKMGRSKFPGKPSKIGNRKRVNLSSCALPDDNDSSKAAKNIYLGLSVFNETFGDNEMVAPGPFHGFSMAEVEEAMANARLQQNEAEVEHKKHGINFNFWESFQNELFSIMSCSSNKTSSFKENQNINTPKLSFDGGGYNNCKDTDEVMLGKEKPQTFKEKNKKKCALESQTKNVKFYSPKLRLSKMQCSPSKSLQSQAAKKLLEKAKLSNFTDSSKNNLFDKKFVLPNRSIHSSRIIKPNKKFLEGSSNRRKFLRSKSVKSASDQDGNVHIENFKSSNKKGVEESKKDFMNSEDKRKAKNSSVDVESKKKLKVMDSKSSVDSNKSQNSTISKVILREPRLQLDNNNSSILEGPFSSPSASSLSPSSKIEINTIQPVNSSGSLHCGVCGIVKLYRFVDKTKKFGIYCCESCRKFISKVIKGSELQRSLRYQCLGSKGLCGIMPVGKSQTFGVDKGMNNTRCEACWLKMCLKNFKLPIKLKNKLMKLLPVNMQMGITLELSALTSKDIKNKFTMGNNNNMKDFKWLNENSNSSNEKKSSSKSSFYEKQLSWPNPTEAISNEKCLRKRKRVDGIDEKTKPPSPNFKTKLENEDKLRQAVSLKGPRVKHVCRSASVALGQPLATFPGESSPTKKLTNELTNECKNCDNNVTTNNGIESQGNINKPIKDIPLNNEGKEEKKSKQGVSLKASNTVQQQKVGNKAKKKSNVKAENPISMDFWESYDPDEVCETGFGLIGSENFTVRALCFLCGSSGQEKLIHCASCCEPYHEFCVDQGQLKFQDDSWKCDWVCPRCTICFTCGRTSGQQLKCVKCDNSYHIECVDRVGGRLLHSPDRPWVCSVCLRCKSCNGVDVSVFVGNLPLCKACFVLRQKGNYCPLCQRCYEDDDYDSKMMECGQCKCWVHAKCEGLSDEKYQVLSFLPESVEYICRMCCVMPPAPWWLAVEAELKSGYLGVLKALSKNRKACTMLKWSPRKQCTCRQLNFVSRSLYFEEKKTTQSVNDKTENSNTDDKNKNKSNEQLSDKTKEDKYQPASITERKTSIEVINHPSESLKLTLKFMKESEVQEKSKSEPSEDTNSKLINEEQIRAEKKMQDRRSSNEETSQDLPNMFTCAEDSQTSMQSVFKENYFNSSSSDYPSKRSLPSPVNPPSDSGIGSTDDELKTNCFTDEESYKPDDVLINSNSVADLKSNLETPMSFLEEKRECFCFLEVDSYNSRSKPFSPNLMSIKKKVTTSEYSSLHQFHQDMQRMISTTQSTELMDLYYQTMKEIFPWFDPKFSRVQSNSQRVSGTMSLESTPVKNTPQKNSQSEVCTIPKEKLLNQSLEYFYSNYVVEDNRICLMCKTVGDGPPNDTGRLLYCGQNEWVHCNCALWSGEVFEEIDGSLQNVHSAISRGRSIRCPECNLKGASIGCCARNCQETYHFRCARQIGCIFMDDKTVYCPAHTKESLGKLVQNEKEFEIRRPVYVELDKRKMKTADSSQIRFAVGALHVNNLGRFIVKLSDRPEAIIPEQFDCTRLFWSCYEPWRIVRYHFTIRLLETEDDEGLDCGINFTIDHSQNPELLELKLKQLKHFQEYNALLDIDEKIVEERLKEKHKLLSKDANKLNVEETFKVTPVERPKKESKVVKRIFDQFDSKDDDNCLSDNQNTTGLLPPDLEEAIFKDLPHDILDGISMQDIFMDIKNDSYDSGGKEDGGYDPENEEISENVFNKPRKNEQGLETGNQTEIWNEITSDSLSTLKALKNYKRSKTEVLSNQQIKKSSTLKSYQKSCGLNWNCKTEGNTKWKKNPKCHVTVNLLEPQERGNMLQELKFTDGLVSVSTGPIGSLKDLKTRLEDSKRSLQQEEGKENKCLQWHSRLQPRLLQVDGNVDSSSSGSEAGESPQRLLDETLNSKIVSLPQSSPSLDSPIYSLSSPSYPDSSSYVAQPQAFSSDFSNCYEDSSSALINTLPQLDGVCDHFNDSNDSENWLVGKAMRSKRVKLEEKQFSNWKGFSFRINQCDGGIDSESDEEESCKLQTSDDLSPLNNSTKDEPVKCDQCHCTYRTKISYQRHLEACCNDFMLSSSEEEMSEDESPKKSPPVTSLKNEVLPQKWNQPEVKIKKEVIANSPTKRTPSPVSPKITKSPKSAEKLEIKKEKAVKRTYARKKSTQPVTKPTVVSTFQQVQQSTILVQQPNTTPTLIVQDMPTPNVVPTAFIDSTPTLGYLAAMDPQNSFGKPQLIATPNGIIQIPPPPETQVLGGLCLNANNVNMQAGVPGILIQQPNPLISSQPTPIMMSNDGHMMVNSGGLFDVIRDPTSGRMFLTNHNQPVFYNMETIVSNTVMQTNQFVSNVLATSYSQTSTQIFQARELEQVVNIPSNYIVVGPNPTTEKVISSEDLICVQTPQTVIPNQPQIQLPSQPIFNPTLQTPTVAPESKIISTQLNPIRCIQPLQVKPICPPIVLNKIANPNTQIVNQPVTQVFQPPQVNTRPMYQNTQVKAKAVSGSKSVGGNTFRSMPMMRPNVTPPKGFERAVAMPRVKPQQAQPKSRALVDYINNFRSDACDLYSPEESMAENKVVDIPARTNTVQKTVCKPISNVEMSTMSSTSPTVPSSLPDICRIPAVTQSEETEKLKVSPTPQLKATPPLLASPPLSSPVIAPSVSSPVTTSLASPVVASPLSSPVAASPLSSPVAASPLSSPVAASPLSSPVAASPLSSPVAASPLSSPVVASSLPSPVIASPQRPDVGSGTLEIKKLNSSSKNDFLEFFSSPSKPDSSVENDKEVEVPAEHQSPKVFRNVMNSLSFEEEPKLSLSMPTLEDSPPSPELESPKSRPQTPTINCEKLPLQENVQSINTIGKTKSPQKLSPSQNLTLSPEEKSKLKKKAFSDENLDITYSTKLKPEKEDNFLPKPKHRKNTKKNEERGPKLIFDVTSDDGYKNSSTSMAELWANICDSVQEMRAVLKIPPLPVSRKSHEILGMENHGLLHCLEQLKGVEQCLKYKCKYFIKDEPRKEEEDYLQVEKENLSGCARTEEFTSRKEYDMFAWLASKHRKMPKLSESAEETLTSIRRANSLPLAMKYRNLKETAKLYLGVYRSKIHGKGLFCLREIEAGEMVIEYAGEVIRSTLTDKREKYYTDKGIGCYMFRIDDHFVIDATMKGNAARFINHSCEPNCYSKVVDILGKKHIVIFALRRINIMEELTYDYKFPFEDEKISCHCLSKKCRKYLN